MNCENITLDDLKIEPEKLNFADKWIINRLNETINESDRFYDSYDFGEAAKVIYNFTWNDFASWYIEMAKINQDTISTKAVLLHVLEAIIKLLHPFMPFVTEEIYQMMPHKEPSIMVSKWPVPLDMNFEEAMNKEYFFEIIKGLRTIRNDYNVSWAKQIDLYIKTTDDSVKAFLLETKPFIDKLVNPGKFIIESVDELELVEQSLSIILPDCQIFIPMGSLVDPKEELAKLQKELSTLENEISRSEKMLSNPSFLNKAPSSKIEEEKTKYENYQKAYEETKNRLEELMR
jgi:valyl-tRNA synthetase